MPIRFRCAYCNQLMGIARRKAGTVVSCPNCSGQVVVPAEDVVETSGSGPTAPPDKGSEPLFERGDFDDLFRSGKGMGAPSPPAPPPPPPPRPMAPAAAPPQQQAPMPPPPRLDFASPQPAPAPALPPPVNGYVISPSMATLLSVALIVALALAFTAGLLVGRFYLQPSAEEIRPVPAETR
jgi:hypothetical protein